MKCKLNITARLLAATAVWAFIVVLGLVAPATAQTCVASGDINGSGGADPTPDDISMGDISMLVDHLLISHFTLAYPYKADVVADCMVDREDFNWLYECHRVICDPGPCCPWPGPTTCCDPLMIFSTDTARALGVASVTYSAGVATVTNIGTSGDDGLRFYTNMEDVWQNRINLGLNGVDFAQAGKQASIKFTRVDTTMDMEWAANVAGENNGSAVFLTTGLGLPFQSTVTLAAFGSGGQSYSGDFFGNELVFAAVTPTNPLAIVGVTFSIDNSFRLAVSLGDEVDFSVVGQSPEVTFTADLLILSSTNPYQALRGLGPIVMTGAGMESFSISSTYLCCIGRVGDANGSGEDMPTIGDISAIVDALFVSGNCNGLPCLAEADFNQSGGWNPECSDITIGDVSFAIDYLFITSPAFMERPACLNPE